MILRGAALLGSPMKPTRMFQIIVVSFVFALTGCHAQSPEIRVTPSNETTLNQWHKFSSPDGSFEIYFPGQPFEQQYSMDSPSGKLDVRSYRFIGSASYFISYTDYPSAIDGTDAKSILDRARDGGVRAVNGHLIRESPDSLKGHPGRPIVVDSPNGGPKGSIITNRVYLVGHRLFSMQVAISKDRNESLDAAAQKFLDSFKLVEASGQ